MKICVGRAFDFIELRTDLFLCERGFWYVAHVLILHLDSETQNSRKICQSEAPGV